MPDAAVAVAAVMMTAAAQAASWSMRAADGELRSLAPQPILTLSSLLMVREAVLAGIGAAMLPQLLVGADVAAGRLACWGTEDGPEVEIWALYNSRRLLSAKVRAFIDALVQGLAPAAPGGN
jgi:DNA-binding transcriptional LysR family regulator